MPHTQEDQDVQAVRAIKSALDPLDHETRKRVLDAALALLGMPRTESAVLPPPSPQPGGPEGPPSPISDIRTLRDRKKPRSDVEMAVLVAYYLSDLAPSSDRRESISTSDITRYFDQAGHPRPARPRDVLSNAKKAGYFDLVSRNQYKLNPVGYNLAAYGLPRSEPQRATTKGPRKRGTAEPRRKSKTSTPKRRSSRRR